MAGKGMGDRMKMMQQIQQGGLMDPSGRLAKQKKGTGKRLSNKERAKLKKQRDKELRRRKREKKRPAAGPEA
jgi:signal recognition particle subunit SRP54